MKIISFNVNGLRAQVKKDFFKDMETLDPDVICIQETKAQDDQVIEALEPWKDRYNIYPNSAVKKGYSSTAILTKKPADKVANDMGVKVHDQEGRVIMVDLGDFQLVNVYVPNAGNGLKRLDYRGKWDRSFGTYLRKLNKIKPVIITGDFNVAHQAIDLSNPKSNYNKTAGYTQKEIDGFSKILGKDFVDIWRDRNPERVQYTYWSLRTGARARNAGWRIDYFLVSRGFEDRVKSVEILNDVMGSDHCPVLLEVG